MPDAFTPSIILEDIVPGASPLTAEEQAEFLALTTDLLKFPFCPWTPTLKQAQFCLDFGKESLYGGAVGGAKSIALMMAASMFLEVPGYEALILRKRYTDLEKPGALMDIAKQWWAGKPGVKFDQKNHAYIFQCPDGGESRITFGAMENRDDYLKYQGGRYHFVGYDELTQFRESDFVYLFSRMRRVAKGPLSRIPIRMRATCNPGGPGHEWVMKRFIVRWYAWMTKGARRPKRNFHPALLSDNEYLDYDDYVESLQELDPVTRAQLLRGDWNIRPDGRMFKSAWFRPIERHLLPVCRWVRGWDMASTDEVPGLDPDYTAGALVGRDAAGRYYLADMRRWRVDPGENDLRCRATAIHDTYNVLEVMEQEPGASGKVMIHHYRVGAFRDYNFRGVPASGKARGIITSVAAGRKTNHAKIAAATPLASKANAGMFFYVNDGSWDYEAFLNEVEIFPDGEHDDQVDGVSLAMNQLAKLPPLDLVMGEANRDFEKENHWRPEAFTNPGGIPALAGMDRSQMLEAARDETSAKARAEIANLTAAAFAV